MARKHRKYLLGLQMESAALYGYHPTTGELAPAKPLTLQEVKRWKKENPTTSLEVFEIQTASGFGVKKKRPSMMLKR